MNVSISLMQSVQRCRCKLFREMDDRNVVIEVGSLKVNDAIRWNEDYKHVGGNFFKGDDAGSWNEHQQPIGVYAHDSYQSSLVKREELGRSVNCDFQNSYSDEHQLVTSASNRLACYPYGNNYLNHYRSYRSEGQQLGSTDAHASQSYLCNYGYFPTHPVVTMYQINHLFEYFRNIFPLYQSALQQPYPFQEASQQHVSSLTELNTGSGDRAKKNREKVLKASSKRGINFEHKERFEEVFTQGQYPSKQIKLDLASETSLPYQQVNMWFQNRRAREKREQSRRSKGNMTSTCETSSQI